MEYPNVLRFNVKWNTRMLTLFAFMLVLPNLLGMLNIGTGMGFKIHVFQVAIFAAALVYGPVGGALSGLVGSTYSAVIMSNPYIIVGNGILGFMVGYLLRKNAHMLFAVWLAFLVQLLWLVPTDYYLIHMPASVLWALIIALAVSNTLWAVCVKYLGEPILKGYGILGTA